MTGNVVLISDQRVLVLKPRADLERPAPLRGQWSRCVHLKIEILTRSFVRMTERDALGIIKRYHHESDFSSIRRIAITKKYFEITIRCHPGLDPGSGSKNEQPGRVASERRTGILGGMGGPLTGNVVSQRTAALMPDKIGTGFTKYDRPAIIADWPPNGTGFSDGKS